MTSPYSLTEGIKREVGQHFVFGFHGYEISDNIKALIEKYHIGNVILMKRNIQSAAQTRKLVKDLQKLAKDAGQKRELLVGIDQENGLVSAFSSPTAGTTFPGAMAMAATRSEDLIESISKASAMELKAVGINWVYSPVADVNTDSRNPVIGVRSFGDDSNSVAKFAAAAMRGHRAGGVASTAKHFPGHGDTHVDSHLALPRIAKSLGQLRAEELIPFQSLIEASIPSIMTGHMALPLINGDDTPCSLSRRVTTELLRQEMKFDGVVVTDCLEMDAIAEPKEGGCGVQEGATKALEAGADVVMICHTFERQRDTVEGVYAALEAGRLSLQELRESGLRIERMKDTFGVRQEQEDGGAEWDKTFAELLSKNKELSRQAYLRSTTVVWNGSEAPVIPLNARHIKDKGNLLLLTPAMESVNKAVDSGNVKNTAGPSYIALAQILGEKVPVQHCVYGADEALPTKISQPEAIIFVMRNADQRRWQLEYLGKLQNEIQHQVPLVLISSCGPYDLCHAEGKIYKEWTGYLATYEFTAEAFEAAVQVIFGEEAERVSCELPVRIDLVSTRSMTR